MTAKRKQSKVAQAKALNTVADVVRRFYDDLERVDLMDERQAFCDQVDMLPRLLRARVNKATADFDVYLAELQDLLIVLDCAASDAG